MTQTVEILSASFLDERCKVLQSMIEWEKINLKLLRKVLHKEIKELFLCDMSVK